jgi:hypothetical protein
VQLLKVCDLAAAFLLLCVLAQFNRIVLWQFSCGNLFATRKMAQIFDAFLVNGTGERMRKGLGG